MNSHHRLNIITCLVLAFCPTLFANDKPHYNLREFDIVFSGSTLGQGAAIVAATGSPYTHCGVVFEKDGHLMVLEAVQPLGVTTLEKFMSRGRHQNFTARRLKPPLRLRLIRKAERGAWLRSAGITMHISSGTMKTSTAPNSFGKSTRTLGSNFVCRASSRTTISSARR